MTGTSDDALALAARAGSVEAYGELFERYIEPVVRLAYRMTKDRDEAKDIAQDVFLCAFRRMGDFHSGRSFAGWIFVIARNASLEALRRRRRTSNVPIDRTAFEASPEEEAVRKSDADSLHQALRALPAKYRMVLEMYYIDQLLYREIGDRLAMPLGTVKTRISRAKHRLRERLGGDEVVSPAAKASSPACDFATCA